MLTFILSFFVEKQMKTFLEKAKEGQASIRNQLRHEEESIAKISEEIIVKVNYCFLNSSSFYQISF